MKLKGVTLVITLLFLIVVGCSEKKQSGDADTLTWLTTSGYSPEAPDAGTGEYLTDKVQAFESEHGMDLKMSLHPTNIDEAMARLLERANTGRVPDMAVIDGYVLDRYQDYLQPLDELMSEAGIDPEDFLPFAEDVITGDDGHIYGLYMSTDTRMLFYNKELVPEPPKDWDEVIDISLSLQEDGYEGLVLPLGIGEGTSVTSLWPLFWGQGGELVDDDGKPTFGEGKNQEYMLNVFETINDAVQKGAISKRMASSGEENGANGEVSTGKTAMFLGGSWQAAFLQDLLGDDFEKWEVASVPMIEGAENTSSAGGWVWGIFTDDADKQEAAFDFLVDTFIGEEGMGRFTSIQGSLPARQSVYDSEYYEPGPFDEAFRASLETEAEVRPASNHYNEISVQLQTAISQVVSGSKTPEQALNDAWKIVTFGEERSDN